MSKEKFDKLSEYYDKDIYYSRWLLKTKDLSTEDLIFVKDALLEGDLLHVQDEDTIYINLNELFGLLSMDTF